MSDQNELHIDPHSFLAGAIARAVARAPLSLLLPAVSSTPIRPATAAPPQPREHPPTPSPSPQCPSGGRRRLTDDGHGAAVAR
jgi:hypothetical protein